MMKTELSKRDLIRRDFYSWLKLRGKLPSGADYTFEGHEYLEQIAKHHWKPGDHIYIRKSAQCGATELAWDWLMWMQERELKGWQASGFCFPAREQLRDHVKARVNPIMELPNFFPYLKSHNLRQMNYKNRPIYFRAAQTRRDLISWSADAVVMDEFDEWEDPLGAIKTVQARFGHSDYSWLWAQSTPKYPDIGIDAAFNLSNQNHWFVPCSSCGKEFSPLMEIMDGSFESCVVRSDKVGAGFVCPNCGELTQTNGVSGRWIQVNEGKPQRYGYSISKVFVGRAKLLELIDSYEDAHNIQEFYNSDLGLPYSPANARLSRQNMLDSSTGAEKNAIGSVEPTCAGVDVGKKCYYIIGKPSEDGKSKSIIAYGTCSFDDLEGILKRFNTTTLVIDLRPYENSVKTLILGKKGWFASDYNASGSIDWYEFTKADAGNGKSVRVVKNHRTQTCDALIEQIAVKKQWEFPRQVKGDNIFMKQMCASQRMEKPDKDTGEIKAFYGNGGRPDHYFHAAAFLLLAFLAKKKSVFALLGPSFH